MESLGPLLATITAKLGKALKDLLNHLNAIGAIVLAYALMNPQAAQELIALLPAPYRPYAPMLALGWWAVVNYAKGRAIKKAGQA